VIRAIYGHVMDFCTTILQHVVRIKYVRLQIIARACLDTMDQTVLHGTALVSLITHHMYAQELVHALHQIIAPVNRAI
jgi:hypothetical protein